MFSFFADIDECNEAASYCGTNTDCTNLPGTFDCSCTEGYLTENTADLYSRSSGCCEFEIIQMNDRALLGKGRNYAPAKGHILTIFEHKTH